MQSARSQSRGAVSLGLTDQVGGGSSSWLAMNPVCLIFSFSWNPSPATQKLSITSSVSTCNSAQLKPWSGSWAQPHMTSPRPTTNQGHPHPVSWHSGPRTTFSH